MTGTADSAEGETTDSPELRIPRGNLLRSRVVSDVGTTLSRALEQKVTGYATLVPQETLLLSGEAKGVLTFEDGIPVLAYNTVTDSGGPDALAELAVPGPYRVELYAVDAAALATAHEEQALRVAPGAAATELADDQALAERVRDAAPDDRVDNETESDADAVAAFLEDDDRIEAIREQARAEAQQRAAEWGLDDALNDADNRSSDASTGADAEGVDTDINGRSDFGR